MSLGSTFGQAAKFGVVGGGATFIYFCLAIVFDLMFGLGPIVASTMAYASAAVFSYVGHKYFTFNARENQHGEKFRFLVSSLTCFFLAMFIPWALGGFLPVFSYIAVTILVPFLSFFMLRLFVFNG
jgi:putative flippase GtrA